MKEFDEWVGWRHVHESWGGVDFCSVVSTGDYIPFSSWIQYNYITGLLVRDIYGRGVVPDWRSANASTHSAWTTVLALEDCLVPGKRSFIPSLNRPSTSDVSAQGGSPSLLYLNDRFDVVGAVSDDWIYCGVLDQYLPTTYVWIPANYLLWFDSTQCAVTLLDST